MWQSVTAIAVVGVVSAGIIAVFFVPGVAGMLRGFAFDHAPVCDGTIAGSCRGLLPVHIEFVDYDVNDTGPPADVAEIVDVVGSHVHQQVVIRADISPLGVHGGAEIWRGDVTAVDISGRRIATNLHPNFVGSVVRTIVGVAILALPFILAGAARRSRLRIPLQARPAGEVGDQAPD